MSLEVIGGLVGLIVGIYGHSFSRDKVDKISEKSGSLVNANLVKYLALLCALE